MKRTTGTLVLSLLVASLLLMAGRTAAAQTVKGKSGLAVTFTKDKKLKSNFNKKTFDDAIYTMQPGDTAHFSVKVQDSYGKDTDWYMSNEILNSLEDRSSYKGTAGDAYSYRLTYTDPDGKEEVLFDSESVGGDHKSEAGEGLKEADSGLKDFFFLDRLSPGDSGRIDLMVALEGDTQGNAYQNTLADLQLTFAVELPTSSSSDKSSKKTPKTGRTVTRSTVKTGDENRPLIWLILAGVSGICLLIFGIFTVERRRRDRKGGRDS